MNVLTFTEHHFRESMPSRKLQQETKAALPLKVNLLREKFISSKRSRKVTGSAWRYIHLRRFPCEQRINCVAER